MPNPLSNPSYLVPPLVVFASGLILASLVLHSARRSFTKQVFLCFVVTVALAGLVVFGMRSSADVHRAVVWDRAAFVLAFAAFVFYYHFTVAYTSMKGHRGILYGAYSLLVVAASLAWTDLVVERMRLEEYGYAPVPGLVAFPMVFMSLFLVAQGISNLVRRYKSCSSYDERNRLLYLIAVAPLLMVGACLDAFSNAPPAGMWTALTFCVISSIVVLKYHLLDIRVILRKALAYLLVSALVAAPYVAVLFFVGRAFQAQVQHWWMHAGLILVLAIVLRPLYSWAQRRVDKLFYRDRYDYLAALEQFSKRAQSVTSLEKLGVNMLKLITGALRVKNASLLLVSEGYDGLSVVATVGLDDPPPGIVLRSGGLLVRWMRRCGDIISSWEFCIIPELQNVARRERQNLEKLKAELYVPVKTRDGELSGLLILGEKLSQQDYSIEDRQLLSTISSQTAVSLENARLYTDAVRAREDLEVWLNSMSDCVIIVNADQTVQFMNKAAKQSFDGSIGARCWSTLGRTTPCPGCPINESTKAEDVSHHVINVQHREYDVVAAQLLDPDGSRSVIEVLRDVTERKRMEIALRQSEEKLHLMFESVTQGVIVSDLNADIVQVNQAALHMHGYDRKDGVIGQSAFEFIAEKDRTKARRNLKRTIDQDYVNNIEFTLLRKDGTEFDAELSTAVMRDASGTPIGFVATTQDISERKRAEERERELQEQLNLSSRLASVGELAAGVAHEINNPLTGILGFSHRLLRKCADEKIRQDLESIYGAAVRTAKIVQNLLAFARHREPEKQYADLNDAVKRTLELRAYELKTSNIEVVTELAADLPKTMVDFHQIQEVFLNIVLNAEQAMTEANRGGKLRIKTEETNGCIRISFADNGPGIPTEQLNKVFDPFFSLRRERGGTGLGLSVSHGIVTSHGGRIYAKSRPGKGATFFVELPMTTINMDEDKRMQQELPRRDE